MATDPLQTWYEQIDEDTRDWLAMALFYRELETIRRVTPLLDDKKYPVKELKLYDREAQKRTDRRDINLRGGDAPGIVSPHLRRRKDNVARVPPVLARILAKAASVHAIDDTDDDGDDDTKSAKPPAQAPGPLTGMRPGFEKIREMIGFRGSFEREFPAEIKIAQEASLTTGDKYGDRESMLEGPDWRGYFERRGVNLLCRGFPMVEDVVFVKHPNHWGGDRSGNCYWLALALLLYGKAHAWLRVKAEHLSYLEKVLMDPNHPRHAFYSRENQVATATVATGPEDNWSGAVNLWEKLLVPGCWANEDLCHITADVCGVFLVVYKFDGGPSNPQWANRIYDMKAYGSYNSRHIFLCYHKENHFQPMVPNDFYAYEFKLPRMTLQNTKKYRLVTKEHSRIAGDGPRHHWRGRIQTIPAPLALPSFELQHLRRAVGYFSDTKKPPPPPPPRGVSALTPKAVQGVGARAKPSTPDPTPKSTTVVSRAAAAIQAARDAADAAQQKRSPAVGATPPSTARRPVPPSRLATQTASAGLASTPRAKRRASDSPEVILPRIKRLRGTLAPAAYTPPPTTTPSTARQPPPSTSPYTFTAASPYTPNPGAQPPASKARPQTLTHAAATQNPATRWRSTGTQTQPQHSISPSDQANSPILISSSSSSSSESSEPPPALAAAPQPPGTSFRPATRPILRSKVRLRRLREWCLDLGLVTDRQAKRWKKEQFVDELLQQRVEVLMRRRGPRRGWEPVSSDEEDRGVEVIREPLVGLGSSDGYSGDV